MNPRFSRALQNWFVRECRELPWRATDDPYHILVSEVMLQQTRAQTVIPYFERFLARFPDVHALAAARESEVLACWSGLGYYSRARNLQAAARAIVAVGSFPSEYDVIRALPGVGPWTVAHVALRSLGDPDAFPAGDLGLQLAATRLGLADHAVGLARRAKRWRPWRGYAAHYLWEVTA